MPKSNSPKRKKASFSDKKRKSMAHAAYALLLKSRHTRRLPHVEYNNLRNNLTRSQIEELMNSPMAKTERMRETLWGESYPKSIDKLGVYTHDFSKAESFRNEIDWLYVQVKCEADKLGDFIKKRDRLENLILLGKLDLAESLLEEVRKDTGYSVWYYEMRFLILAREGKEAEVCKLQSEINQKNLKSRFIAYIIYNLAKRSLGHYSAHNYDAELDARIARSRTDLLEDQCDFYHLFLNYYRSFDFTKLNLAAAACFVAPLSLIDRYNFLLNLLRISYVKHDAEKQYVTRTSYRLYKKIPDRQLLPLAYIEDENIVDSAYYDADLIEILDGYYTGQFDKTLQRCRIYISDKPSNFDVVKIYVRTLIFKNEPFFPIAHGTNVLVNDIAKLVYQVLTTSENADELSQFYQLHKSIYGLTIACGMDYFYRNEKFVQSDATLYALSLWNYNPIFSKLLGTEERRMAYIQKGIYVFGNNSFLNLCMQKEHLKSVTDNKILSCFRDVQNAEIVYQKGDFEEAIRLWTLILKDNEKYMPITAVAVRYIYDCYVRLGRNMDAVRFYVKEFMQGSTYVSKIKVEEFMKYLRNNQFQCGLKHHVDVLIFVFKNAEIDDHKGFILERYWDYIGTKSVKGFIDYLVDGCISIEKIEKVLTYLLMEDILRHVTYVTSTKILLLEQYEASKFLTSLDCEKHNLYEDWNQQIINEIKVYDNANKMDESRIYANKPAIYKYLLVPHEDLYRQFKDLYKLSMSGDYLFFKGSNMLSVLLANGH